MSQNEIVILSGARTAIGGFGGSLAAITPIDLATTVTRAAIERAGIEADRIGTVVFGHVLNTEPRDMYLSRVAMLNAGGQTAEKNAGGVPQRSFAAAP